MALMDAHLIDELLPMCRSNRPPRSSCLRPLLTLASDSSPFADRKQHVTSHSSIEAAGKQDVTVSSHAAA